MIDLTLWSETAILQHPQFTCISVTQEKIKQLIKQIKLYPANCKSIFNYKEKSSIFIRFI